MGGHGGRGRVTRATSTQDGSQSSAPQSGSRSHRAGHWARHRTNICTTSPAMTWPAELRGFAAGEQGPRVRPALPRAQQPVSQVLASGFSGALTPAGRRWSCAARPPLRSHCPSPSGVLTRGPVCGDSPSSLGCRGRGEAGVPAGPRRCLGLPCQGWSGGPHQGF